MLKLVSVMCACMSQVAAGGISEYWLYIGVSPLSGSAVPHDHLILKKGILNTTYTFTEEVQNCWYLELEM